MLNSNVHNEERLRTEVASCTGALETSIIQHTSKQEEQVYV